MPQIQLRLSFYFFLLLFTLIACQATTPEAEVVPTEPVAALSPTEESEGESVETPVPESTEVAEDEMDSAESTEVAEDEMDSAESTKAAEDESDLAQSAEIADDESYTAPKPEEAEVVEEVLYPPPPPTINAASTAYPEPSPETEVSVELDSYPDPDEVITATPSPTLLSEQRFELASLQAGDTEIRGRGPAGLSIALVDVSLGGDLITTGKIEEDGTFVIKVPQPLESDHHLGLKVGPLYGTPFADQEEVVMQDARLLIGEYAFDLPSIGLIVTSRRVP